jgi:hypothetical protein
MSSSASTCEARTDMPTAADRRGHGTQSFDFLNLNSDYPEKLGEFTGAKR